MRKFTTVCKDTKTNYEMILSECSYNQAVSYMANILNGIPLVEVKNEMTYVTYHNGKKFCYDETRGYLMKCF